MPTVEYYQDREFYYRITEDHSLLMVAKDDSYHWKVTMCGNGKLDWIRNIRKSYQPAPASQVENLFKKYL